MARRVTLLKISLLRQDHLNISFKQFLIRIEPVERVLACMKVEK